MGLSTTVKAGAGVVASIGAIGGGALSLDHLHASQEEFNAFRAEQDTAQHVNSIQGWIRAAREEGASESICDAIRAELTHLCSKNKDHYLCSQDMTRDTLKRAGCE